MLSQTYLRSATSRRPTQRGFTSASAMLALVAGTLLVQFPFFDCSGCFVDRPSPDDPRDGGSGNANTNNEFSVGYVLVRLPDREGDCSTGTLNRMMEKSRVDLHDFTDGVFDVEVEFRGVVEIDDAPSTMCRGSALLDIERRVDEQVDWTGVDMRYYVYPGVPDSAGCPGGSAIRDCQVFCVRRRRFEIMRGIGPRSEWRTASELGSMSGGVGPTSSWHFGWRGTRA